MKFSKMHSPGYLANHMARLFALGLAPRIKPLGITPGQFPALLELFEKDGQTQKELVGKLDIEQATLANTLARMERDGLVVRREHPSDARAKTIHLTKKAKDIKAEAVQAARAQNEEALARLTDAERVQFVDLMRRVVETMKATDTR